jgi:transposase
MARAFPRELRDEVVNVARKREPGVTLKQIATDFGISEATLQNWLKKADKADGIAAGTVVDDSELRELKKRNRRLEQENEILRRAAAYFSQASLPK